MKSKNPETFFCVYCEETQDYYTVVREETHFYSVSVETGQWEDEGEDAGAQQYFCLKCGKKNTTY